MRILQARLHGIGPFGDQAFPFTDERGDARSAIAVLGGAGVGKTSLLAAIATTRPGCAIAQPRHRGVGAPAFAVTEWHLGQDDLGRPHPLRVVSPGAAVDEPEDSAALRRREQAVFDRRAAEGGFAFLAFPGSRWFSRAPVLLTSPERNALRYEPRGGPSFDDATRADLTRETKQALAYAAISATLARAGVSDSAVEPTAGERLEHAVRAALEPLAGLLGARFAGVDPSTLEPVFATSAAGSRVGFDELPTSSRHLVAFAALTARVLFAAYPGRDPRESEGVALVDDLDLYQEPASQKQILPALREALPRVQWIVTTSSQGITLGCESQEVLALRRMPESEAVELYGGELAILH